MPAALPPYTENGEFTNDGTNPQVYYKCQY
jgi:hypothetical protein